MNISRKYFLYKEFFMLLVPSSCHPFSHSDSLFDRLQKGLAPTSRLVFKVNQLFHDVKEICLQWDFEGTTQEFRSLDGREVKFYLSEEKGLQVFFRGEGGQFVAPESKSVVLASQLREIRDLETAERFIRSVKFRISRSGDHLEGQVRCVGGTPPGDEVDIPLKPLLNYDDVHLLAIHGNISDSVRRLKGNITGVCIESAMKTLAGVGNLLRVAFAASGYTESSEEVYKIATGFRGLVRSSYRGTGSFLGSCMDAINTCQFAWDFVKRGDLQEATQEIKAMSKLAEEMAGVARSLQSEADKLKDDSDEAAKRAMKDHRLSEERRQAVQKRIDEESVNKAKLTARENLLKGQLTDLEAKLKEIESACDNAEKKSFLFGVLKAIGAATIGEITKPIMAIVNVFSPTSSTQIQSNVQEVLKIADQKSGLSALEDEIKSLEEQLGIEDAEASGSQNPAKKVKLDPNVIDQKKDELRRKKEELNKKKLEIKNREDALSDLQKQSLDQLQYLHGKVSEYERLTRERNEDLRNTKISLAGSIETLKNLKEEGDELQRAALALGMVKSRMGEVSDAFDKIATFWEDIKNRCDRLTLSDDEQLRFKSEMKIRVHIQRCFLSLVTVGELCFLARESLGPVREGITSFFKNLPANDDEAQKIIDSLGSRLLNNS